MSQNTNPIVFVSIEKALNGYIITPQNQAYVNGTNKTLAATFDELVTKLREFYNEPAAP
jgi:hypothetical protein